MGSTTIALPAIADTYLNEAAPTTNYGSDYEVVANAVETGGTAFKLPLFRFDLSDLPDDAEITGVKLRMYFAAVVGYSSDYAFHIYSLKRLFDEASATYNKYDATHDWETPGAFGASDRDSDYIGGFHNPGPPFTAGWYEIANLYGITAKTHNALQYGLLVVAGPLSSSGWTQVGCTIRDRSQSPAELIVTYDSTTVIAVAGTASLPPIQFSGKALVGDYGGMTYYARNASTGLPVPGDAANHTIRWLRDGVPVVPYGAPFEVDATNCPGVYCVRISESQRACRYGALAGKSSTENVVVEPALNAPGATTVDADVSAISGSTAAADNLKAAAANIARDANAILRGAVFVDETYTATDTVFYTTLPVRADGYADMVLRFDDGAASGVWRQIAASETVDTYTKITLSTALSAAPTTGTLVSAGGNKE